MNEKQIKEAFYRGVVIMQPMAPPIYRWQMERPNFWAQGPARETEAEAEVDLKKFQLIIEIGTKQTEPI